MIESVSIADIASFGPAPQVLGALKKFNYIFGSNASGKTTISRIIAQEEAYPTCGVTWTPGSKCETKVYNWDFIKKNFSQSDEFPGVFTLGADNIEVLSKIKTTKADAAKLADAIHKLTCTLRGEDGEGGERAKLARLHENFTIKCWTIKQKHDEKLKGAFEGYRGRKADFKAKLLKESEENTAQLKPISELEKRAETVFGKAIFREQPVPIVVATSLIEHESNPILEKRVIGKGDVDIAAMITRLGNSDWVRQGMTFYDQQQRICPFCQQETTEAFSKSLEDYFDETFAKDTKAIEDLSRRYAEDSENLHEAIAAIVTASSRFLDIEKLKAQRELLDARVAANVQRLQEKAKEPSKVVELESVEDIVKTISDLIATANESITEHNRIVSNRASEKATLTAEVWRFVQNELRIELSQFIKNRDDLEKAINGLEKGITEKKGNQTRKQAEIVELERQTTSIQPTIDEINKIMVAFGFTNFSLSKSDSGNAYRLVRRSGDDAKETLSEGEKSFVTFLYFYHLLKGSTEQGGVSTDRIVVFDDPVSSLDSDVLFIVSILIKGVLDEVRNGGSPIKQVFVLTHNVYFHKELTFNSKRGPDTVLNEETFWKVRKSVAGSILERFQTNPIKSSYELLWHELKEPDPTTIQNTLRRILENYFKHMGGIDHKKICDKFEGTDKIICNSLLSWVDAGSHQMLDDIYIAIDGGAMETYLRVFRTIFERSSHIAHYKMMMGDAFVEELATATIAVSDEQLPVVSEP